jgi:hypothetical protein
MSILHNTVIDKVVDNLRIHIYDVAPTTMSVDQLNRLICWPAEKSCMQ